MMRVIMGYKKFKIGIGLWWRNWKCLHRKPYRECDVSNLLKRREFHKHMSYSYLATLIILLGIITEMYLRSQGDIVFNMLLVLTMLALYDTKNEMNYIDQYIYMKEKENNNHVCRE